METIREQKLISLAQTIKESVLFDIPGIVTTTHIALASIALAGIFRAESVDLLQELENMGMISDWGGAEWPEYYKNSAGKEEKISVDGFTMEVNINKLNAFVDAKELTTVPEEATQNQQISLVTEKGIGYFKFHKQGERIKIGGIKTRKFRLLQELAEPIGVAKTIDIVFEKIKMPRDERDGRLSDSYLSHARQVELIGFAIKELQKIKKLQGRIRFTFGGSNKQNIRMEVV